jgi:hypothetical protein
VLTVVQSLRDGPVLRKVFAGEGGPGAPGGYAFRAAMTLSADVNIETVGAPFSRCLAYLDADEYRSKWLGNKAIYRTVSRWPTAASWSWSRRGSSGSGRIRSWTR